MNLVQNWWELETDYYVNERGIDPDKARIFVILRWMYHGDCRPLIAAIDADQKLDKGVLNLLASMLEGDKAFPYRLKAVSRRRGRAKRPEHIMRDLIAARAYEAQEGRSDENFDYIGTQFGKSHQTVRRALTAYRAKANRRAK